jgi:response regulator NasT
LYGGIAVTNIIVAFAKIDDAKSIKNILVKNGMSVVAVCTSGAQALGYMDEFRDGIVICGYRMADMVCVELNENLPRGFEMIVMATQRALNEVSGTGIIGLSMPLKVHELVDTVGMMSQGITRRRKKLRETPRVRNEEDESTILNAKLLLMERNSMTEEEAHRYLQKHSMDNGTNMVETAQMALAMFR